MSGREWTEVEVEPAHRYRILPDGRKMFESKITVSREQMERMWQGYMCAACLEDLTELGAYPERCSFCNFPVRAEQRQRLEQDFVGFVEELRRQGFREREEAFLEEHFHIPKAQIVVRKGS